MTEPRDRDLLWRIRSGIKSIKDHSPWKKNDAATQTMGNAMVRDEGRRLIRLLRAAIGEESNEFSAFFPPD